MKTIVLLLLTLSFRSFAVSEARCDIVNGFYTNSPETLTDLRFETLVDIFTLTNAKTLKMRLEGEELRFLRDDISVDRQTKMVYIQKVDDQVIRAIKMIIDRNPKEVLKTKEFYGNMFITPNMKGVNWSIGPDQVRNLTYNFYCRF